MRPILRDLCELLSEQKSILETMLALSQEERRIIISGESELLEDVVRQGMRELSKLGKVEKRRLELHDAISSEFRMPKEDISVTAIAKRAAASERVAITKLQVDLTELIKQHNTLNNENRELIMAHIEYSEAMMELMVDSEDPLNNYYGNDGKAPSEKKKNTGFIDSKA